MCDKCYTWFEWPYEEKQLGKRICPRCAERMMVEEKKTTKSAKKSKTGWCTVNVKTGTLTPLPKKESDKIDKVAGINRTKK